MDRASGKAPLHAQLYATVLDEIESGRLAPGDQVPTEAELHERFGVSRTTIRRALHDLANSGFIVRQPGRGTFVTEPHIEQELERLTGFVEDVSAAGYVAQAKVINIRRVSVDRQVAEALNLRLHEQAMRFERIRLANFQPLSVDVSYFRTELGERLAEEDLEVDPFYSILEEKYDMKLGEADYLLRAAAADDFVSGHLRVDVGAPVLLIERTTHLEQDDEPIMFEYLHYRADRVRYRLRLRR